MELDGKRNFEPVSLMEITTQFNNARDERLRLETFYYRLKSIKSPIKLLDSIPETATRSNITKIKMDYTQLKIDQVELSKRAGDRHPGMISIRQKIEALESRIPVETRQFLNAIYTDYKTAQDRENKLRMALKNQENKVQKLDSKLVEYSSLKEEVDSYKRLYDMFLGRMKELDLSSSYRESNVRIVDHAEIPRRPVKPNKLFNMLVASFLGIFGGISLIAVRESMNKSIITVEDVEAHFPFPFLGGIGIVDNNDLPLPTLKDTRSLVSEEFRALRTNLMMSPLVETKKVIMVSSSTPQEGKTTIISNLALSLVQQNKRVLIIDSDCVKPKIHLIFNTAVEPGLIEVLEGKATLDDSIVESHVKNLFVLPVGILSDQFTEALTEKGLAEIINKAKSKFDFILIDTPPVLAFSYVSIIPKLSDVVLFIIGSGINHKEIISRSMKQLTMAPIPAEG